MSQQSSSKDDGGLLSFFNLHHPSNKTVLADRFLAESVFLSLSGERDCLLDRNYPNEDVRNAHFNAFMQIIVFSDDKRGVRTILDDLMIAALPKRNPRVLFGGTCPKAEIKKWPVFAHDAFNAYLGKNDFDHRKMLDKLWEDKLDNLAIWLMGCSDAHFINISED